MKITRTVSILVILCISGIHCESNYTQVESNSSCVPAVPVVNASTKNAACIFYNYTVENGICKNSLTSLYVFGDSGTLQHGEDEIAKMERFFREVQSFEISETCKPIMIDLFCRYHFPPCDTSLDRPHARRICRKSCANLVHGLCEKEIVFFREAIAALPGLLDENILNCTLYDIANGGDVPECYQYHTVPGDDTKSTDCYYGVGVGYQGNVNITRSGLTCQAWRSQCPHRHWRIPEDIADGENGSNACRNPDSSAPDGPWCYTADPKVRWEYCNVSRCPPRVPEEAPSSLKGYPLNSSAIRISWKSLSPSRHKEQLLGYRVKYRRLPSQTYKEVNITSNFTKTVLTRLVAQTEYEIEVNGFNEIGHGPASKVLVVKTVSLGEVAVDLNIQLVIDTDFNNDLLNRSSNKFMAMEEKIRTAIMRHYNKSTVLKIFDIRVLRFSMGSVEADLEVLAIINSNKTRKAEALNHLVEGLDSGILEGLNVSAIRVLDNIIATELTKAGWKTTSPDDTNELHFDESTFSSTRHSNRTFQVQKKILLVHKSWTKERSKLSHYVARFLDGLRAPYVVSEVDDRPFLDLKEDLKPDLSVGRYSLVIFVDIKTYLELKPNVQQIVTLYCKKFGTGLLFFISNHVGTLPEFGIEVIKPLKEKQTLDVEVNENSKLLRLTRRGGSTIKPYVQKGQGTRWCFLRYDPSVTPYETVEYVVNRQQRLKRDLEFAVTDQATVLLDDGRKDGVKKVFFGGGFPFFLHTMLFMDSLEYLSPISPTVFSLERYLQIDVDDIFISKSGIRMKKRDVMEMISVQDRLAQKIPGFKFNLGFSGRSFKQGDDEEDEGDDALLEHAHKFTWFGHLYDHEQPHKHTYEEIVRSLTRNEEFAKKHGIPMDLSYMVAPHHSGVYPVHEPLYDAWSKVRQVRVTSTEEYPHLKPAWFRRGFIYKGVTVLPRQTCGLFTTTNFFSEIKGGKKALDKSIEGGELFETLLRNPVMIVMTHMTNYGNDQLALYTVSRLVNFVHRWTNLELKYASPIELADIYFNLFPRDKVPVWLSPCDDSRHLQIWPNQKSCNRLPSFLVIGPPFGGLDVLVTLLDLHPDFLHAVTSNNGTQGTSFFNSDNYMKGLDWYMEFFPRPTRVEQMSYEVSDEYFTNRDSPYSASNLLKSAKILIVLEDPVKRAFYHYQYLKTLQDSQLPSFDDLVKSKGDPRLSDVRRTILEAGHYSEHIARWMRYYNAKQMSIVSVDDLVSRPITVMNTIQEAVHVETRLEYSHLLRYDEQSGLYCPKSSTNVTECLGFKESRPVHMSRQTEQYLQRYYSRHNQNLLRMNQKIEFPLPKWIHG